MTMIQSTNPIPFTGSYRSDDVQFLLKPITLPDTPIELKETLIQSGQKHYSEMLTRESVPSDDYLTLFNQAMRTNKRRVAHDVILLAHRIYETRSNGITLISLARAGTPIGVLLKHVLKRYFNIEAEHYSISIIRDIGIDQNALRHLLQSHSPETFVFIDGWTGKGSIAEELASSLQDFTNSDGINIPAELYVLSDLSGSAAVSATYEDYLIPSCLLNATVSGLISRSVYDKTAELNGDFHGCVYYQEFTEHDLSNYFITEILQEVDAIWPVRPNYIQEAHSKGYWRATSKSLLRQIATYYGVSHQNYIKPGIGEATRVLLRRIARRLLLQELESETTLHLRWLAKTKSVPVEVYPDLPYHAVALIQEV